jgi:hypothetical protein
MESLTADDPQVMGEYRLRARLGSGGMGRVYLGFSPAGRAVAIKVVHDQLARDPEFLERFGREVAAARAVSGMYTAPVVAAGLDAHPPWLATAFVPGPSLAEVVQQYGALPDAAVWRLGAGLAEALRAVHAAGLVHRDLKPANVLLAADGPHVIDFGISRALEGTSLTSAGMVVGTPGYMSPEQAEGKPTGPASDVFALGCVLAHAATGQPPFGTGNAASVLFKVVSAEPELSGISPALRSVIAACVAKNPAARPTLSGLIATIAASGPELPVSLSAFWPEPMASIIAAGQGYPGATAANSVGGISPAGGVSPPGGIAPVAGGAGQQGYVPTAMATPGQQGGSAAAGFAGHAGMLADGYYAAATGNPATPQPGPGAGSGAGYGTPAGYGATGYAATQAAGGAWQQPQTPAWPGAGSPGSGTPMTPATPWPQPPATPWPNQGSTPSTWPQYGVSGGTGQPVAGAPMPYTPGRRRPMKGEVPRHVLLSVRLMWFGLAAGVLELLLGLIALGKFDKTATKHPFTHDQLTAQTMAGIVAINGVIISLLGLVCWVWLALATRNGRGWTRIAAAVLAGIDMISLLFLILGTNSDWGLKLVAGIAWAFGVAAALLLWGNSARAFFLAWGSKRSQ